MQNQNEDGSKNVDQDFDEEIYDDALEEDFDDSDFLDMELEDDDANLDDYEVSAGDDEDLGEWDEAEEGEEAAYADIGAAALQKKKPRTNLSFNTMAITGAVVLGLCVLGYQVATKKPKFTGDNFQSDIRPSGASDGVVFGEQTVQSTEIEFDKKDGEKTPETGFLDNPEMLDTMGQQNGEAAPVPTLEETPVVTDSTLPTPRSPEDMAANDFLNRPVPDAVPTPVTPVVAPPVVETPPPAMPSAMDMLKSKMAKHEATKQQEPKQEEPIKVAEQKPNIEDIAPPVPVEPEIVEPIVPPVTKIEEKIVPVVEPVIEPVKQPIEEVVPQVVVQKAEMNAELESKLDMIINRLDDMDMQIKQVRETGNSKIEDISENVDTLKQEVSKIAATPSQPVSAPVKKAPVEDDVYMPRDTTSDTASVTPKAAPKKAPVKAVAKASWELRAAQPGRAWVSKKGQKDMQPIVLGDTLSGVGRITSINFDGTRWVVQGTNGRIAQ